MPRFSGWNTNKGMIDVFSTCYFIFCTLVIILVFGERVDAMRTKEVYIPHVGTNLKSKAFKRELLEGTPTGANELLLGKQQEDLFVKSPFSDVDSANLKTIFKSPEEVGKIQIKNKRLFSISTHSPDDFQSKDTTYTNTERTFSFRESGGFTDTFAPISNTFDVKVSYKNYPIHAGSNTNLESIVMHGKTAHELQHDNGITTAMDVSHSERSTQFSRISTFRPVTEPDKFAHVKSSDSHLNTKSSHRCIDEMYGIFVKAESQYEEGNTDEGGSTQEGHLKFSEMNVEVLSDLERVESAGNVRDEGAEAGRPSPCEGGFSRPPVAMEAADRATRDAAAGAPKTPVASSDGARATATPDGGGGSDNAE